MKGKHLKETLIVREKDLAMNVGSGSLPVFATPAMISYLEGAAMRLAQPELSRGQGTVGTFIQVKHLQASIQGETLEVYVEVVEWLDRKITFSLSVTNKQGVTVASGLHERFIIDEDRFMQKLS